MLSYDRNRDYQRRLHGRNKDSAESYDKLATSNNKPVPNLEIRVFDRHAIGRMTARTNANGTATFDITSDGEYGAESGPNNNYYQGFINSFSLRMCQPTENISTNVTPIIINVTEPQNITPITPTPPPVNITPNLTDAQKAQLELESQSQALMERVKAAIAAARANGLDVTDADKEYKIGEILHWGGKYPQAIQSFNDALSLLDKSKPAAPTTPTVPAAPTTPAKTQEMPFYKWLILLLALILALIAVWILVKQRKYDRESEGNKNT